MAGEWIKMRIDLIDDPTVFKIAAALKLDKFSVIGRLHAFWSWADKHSVDGRVDGATSLLVDDIVRCDGFSNALVCAGWLVLGEDHIEIPKHERHHSNSAKERALKNERQARWRKKKDGNVDGDVDGVASTNASTREEKRREDLKDQEHCEQKTDSQAEKAKKPDQIPYDEIRETYNRVCGSTLGQALKLTDARKRAIKKLWNTDWSGDGAYVLKNLPNWEKYFTACLANSHWTGNNDRGWKANLDFLTRESTALRVFES